MYHYTSWFSEESPLTYTVEQRNRFPIADREYVSYTGTLQNNTRERVEEVDIVISGEVPFEEVEVAVSRPGEPADTYPVEIEGGSARVKVPFMRAGEKAPFQILVRSASPNASTISVVSRELVG